MITEDRCIDRLLTSPDLRVRLDREADRRGVRRHDLMVALIEQALTEQTELADLLERAFDYLGRVSDTNLPGSSNLWLEIKTALDKRAALEVQS